MRFIKAIKYVLLRDKLLTAFAADDCSRARVSLDQIYRLLGVDGPSVRLRPEMNLIGAMLGIRLVELPLAVEALRAAIEGLAKPPRRLVETHYLRAYALSLAAWLPVRERETALAAASTDWPVLSEIDLSKIPKHLLREFSPDGV